MKVLLVLMVAGSLLTAGCKGKTSATKSEGAGATNAATGTQPVPLNPETVLVSVNDHKLTVGECDKEVELRLAPRLKMMAPVQVPEARRRMKATVIQDFLLKAMLVRESDRLRIKISAEDEKKAYAALTAKLPPGTTLEQAMANSPAGKERLAQEVVNGLKIDRLIERYMAKEKINVEENIKADYEKEKANIVVPEAVKARHILIRTAPDEAAAFKTEKRKKLEDIRQQIVKGGDFAKLALEHSDCPSKDKGGELPPFTRQRMVKAFEDAAFSQKVNEVGPVVETKFGFHIIQVLEHRQTGPIGYDEYRARALRTGREKAIRNLALELMDANAVKPPEVAEALRNALKGQVTDGVRTNAAPAAARQP